jgi:hypothetical protein
MQGPQYQRFCALEWRGREVGMSTPARKSAMLIVFISMENFQART